jgi:hypothetical protein
MSGATIVDTILSRAVQEHWTAEDVLSAYFQCSLLSYRSTPETPGPRYIRSAPEDYVHNCPWNDWTPPSKSAKIFERANANRTSDPGDPVLRRVRVHVVASASADEKRLIAFATIEKNAMGQELLVLRRGTDVLASLILRRIDVRPNPTERMVRTVSMKVAQKATMQSVLSTYLRFEDETRLYAFDAMISCADKPR